MLLGRGPEFKAHLPTTLDFDTSNKGTIGERDLVLRGPDVTVPAIGPDRWSKLPSIPSGLNSPWSPPYLIPEPPADGRWRARATFSEPGAYVLRAVVSDASVF